MLVRVRATGICGSDLHYYLHGKNGDFVPERPFVLGHESAGEIVDSGAFADALPVGSRVAIDPSHPCRACADCRKGDYNLAIIYLGQAVDARPKHPYMNYHLAMAHFKSGNRDAARTHLVKAVTKEAAYPELEKARALLKSMM